MQLPDHLTGEVQTPELVLGYRWAAVHPHEPVHWINSSSTLNLVDDPRGCIGCNAWLVQASEVDVYRLGLGALVP